jgi:hypothetical protein
MASGQAAARDHESGVAVRDRHRDAGGNRATLAGL